MTTGTGLINSVAGFLHRADLTVIIPDLIALAEVRINGDLDARLQDTRVSINTVATVETVALPVDCINIRGLFIDYLPRMILDYLTPEQLYATYQWSTAGAPQAFTVVNSTIVLAPIPDAIYALQLTYKAKVPSLSVIDPNWLLTTYPNVYLYATLCESAPYLKDDKRIGVWETKYAEAIKVVNAQDWFSGSSMRMRSDVRK